MVEEKKTVYLNLYDDITPPKVKVVMAVCADVVTKERPDRLYICFSSAGGNVDAGITLYSFLRGLSVDVIMHNMGSVDSIATAIFMAGDERYASPHSTFLFHGVAMNIAGNSALHLAQMKELISRLEQDENKIVKVLTDRSQLTEIEVRQLFAVGESKSPEFAQERGIVHGICNLVIPKDAKVISFNMQ